METLIKVKPQFAFGRVDYYPANDLAAQFCSLLNKPNLPKDAIIKLKNMGYEVKETHDETI